MGLRAFFADVLSFFLNYETPKIVVINSLRIILINRITQMCIISYVIGYVLIYNKGYQSVDNVDNVAVITKVKGISVTNYSDEDFQIKGNKDYYNRVWDPVEYVIPPSENGAFFIMTNAIITPNQVQSLCDETPDIPAALCNDSCPVGEIFRNGNGITTGRCIASTQKPEVKVCEVAAWCPVEINKLPLKNNKILINGAENYSVLIKNSIEFSAFRRRYGSSYLQSCYYNEKTDPLCPVFRVGDIIKEAGENFNDVALIGAVMAIIITWNCNLDWDFMTYCIPRYSFRRLYEHSLIHPGWNFRFSYAHEFGRRTVLKAYGIKFVVEVQGEAGQFDLLPTFQNIGAGLGLMALASLFSSIMFSAMEDTRTLFKSTKYEYIKGKDSLACFSCPTKRDSDSLSSQIEKPLKLPEKEPQPCSSTATTSLIEASKDFDSSSDDSDGDFEVIH